SDESLCSVWRNTRHFHRGPRILDPQTMGRRFICYYCSTSLGWRRRRSGFDPAEHHCAYRLVEISEFVLALTTIAGVPPARSLPFRQPQFSSVLRVFFKM